MSEIYSNCCNATAGVKTDYREGTSYHYCKKCGEPCDVYDHSSNLTYEELESKSQILEAENEALKAELADANAHAADFAADCDRLEKELAIKNDALTAALLTSEHLNKELTELKGRSCEGCKHANRCDQGIVMLGYRYAEPVYYCSEWEKRE